MRRIALIVLLVVIAGCGERAQPKKVPTTDVMTPIEDALGPLRVSAANPRYFESPTGKIVYLTGSYTWNALQDWGATNPPRAITFNGYVDFLVAYGHNFTRLVPWEQGSGVPWTIESVWMTPLPYERTGTDAGLDGQPKFDLTKWDEAYFDRLRSRIRHAARRGVYVSVVLFNGLSLGRNAWKGHPFNGANNVNHVDGDANRDGEGEELETLANTAVTARQYAYVDKVIASIGDLENVIWEVGNEPLPTSTAWQQAIAQHLAETERARGTIHPVVGESVVFETQPLWSDRTNESWVWRTFLEGRQPILLDPYRTQVVDGAPVFRDGAADAQLPPRDLSRPEWWPIRKNLGYTRWLASRMDLKEMKPQPSLASTGYCLAAPGRDYLIYVPALEGAGRVTSLFGLLPRTVRVDLSASGGLFATEWFDPSTALLVSGPQIQGGSSRRVSSPFGNGAAVLRVWLFSL